MISILLPTRKRPQNVMRLIESLNDTVLRKDDVELVLRIDVDDEQTRSALPSFMNEWEHVTISQMVKQSTYGHLWHEAYSVARGDIFMVCGDDICFRSKHWDEVVRFGFDSIPDKIAVVFGRDGRHDSAGATHPFVHRNWIETVGHLTAGYDGEKYIDMWLDDIARIINRRVFFPEIFTEHLHYAYGKSSIDETYLANQMNDDEEVRLYRRLDETRKEREREATALMQFIAAFRVIV